MQKDYNPFKCSPEKFYDLFFENYKDHPEHHFPGISKVDRESMKYIERLLYLGTEKRGIFYEAYAVIELYPYSEKQTYSRRKVINLGSVRIASGELEFTLSAKKALENITGVRLLPVKN